MQSRENYGELQSKNHVFVNQKIKINIFEIFFLFVFSTFTTWGDMFHLGWDQRDRDIEERIFFFVKNKNDNKNEGIKSEMRVLSIHTSVRNFWML